MEIKRSCKENNLLAGRIESVVMFAILKRHIKETGWSHRSFVTGQSETRPFFRSVLILWEIERQTWNRGSRNNRIQKFIKIKKDVTAPPTSVWLSTGLREVQCESTAVMFHTKGAAKVKCSNLKEKKKRESSHRLHYLFSSFTGCFG